MTVCEVGAGNGNFAFRIIEKIGSAGKVYANDIVEKGALAEVKKRANEKGCEKLEAIPGTETPPLSPKIHWSSSMLFMLSMNPGERKKCQKIAPSLK